MQTVSDLKALFYDYQHKQAEVFNLLVQEIGILNKQIQEYKAKEEKTEKKD